MSSYGPPIRSPCGREADLGGRKWYQSKYVVPTLIPVRLVCTLNVGLPCTVWLQYTTRRTYIPTDRAIAVGRLLIQYRTLANPFRPTSIAYRGRFAVMSVYHPENACAIQIILVTAIPAKSRRRRSRQRSRKCHEATGVDGFLGAATGRRSEREDGDGDALTGAHGERRPARDGWCPGNGAWRDGRRR